MSILELIQIYPKISIVALASLISLFITVINYFMLDKDRMREIKKKQKDTQIQIKQHQKSGDMQKVMALQKELLADMPEMMKHSFKPMIITFLPIILLFSFMRGAYAETTLADSWFWWYFITTILSSIVFRKLFKLP